MTYNFVMVVLEAWNDKPVTYAQAHKAARAGLKQGKYNQTPQLEGPRALKNTPVFGYVPA